MRLNPTSGCGCCEAPGCIVVPCCGNGLPRTLTVTDSRGAHKIGYNPTAPGWTGEIRVAGIVYPSDDCGPVDGEWSYSYWLECMTGAPENWRLQIARVDSFCPGGPFHEPADSEFGSPQVVTRLKVAGQCDPFSYDFNFTGTGTTTPTFPVTPGIVTVKVEPSDQVDDLCCEPCPLPKKDLWLSWTNPTTGNGEILFTWNPSTSDWTACVHGTLKVRLYCSGGTTHLDVSQYSTAGCTGTVTASCNYPGSLVLASYTCFPVMQRYNVPSSCTAIYGLGYRNFTITEVAPSAEDLGPVFGRFGYNEQPYGTSAS